MPKVNRGLANAILENEEAANDEDADRKKTSKKKKGLSSDILKDERFADMFQKPVWPHDILSITGFSLDNIMLIFYDMLYVIRVL